MKRNISYDTDYKEVMIKNTFTDFVKNILFQ